MTQLKTRTTAPLQAALVSLGLITSTLPSIAFAEVDAGEIDVLKEVEVKAEGDQEVVVDGYLGKRSSTFTKTDTLIRNIPQSISVVTEEQIEDQAVRSIEDAVRYTPGITMAQGEGNRDAVVFRGNQSTADFFIDGTRDDVQYYRDLYNIDRVEVLKGPNGMIFGHGGSGGVINRVTKEATWDPVRELTLQVGSYAQKRAAIDIGQAINDVAAFRLNAVAEDANSFRDGVSMRRHGVNPTVTFLPTDKTRIVLSAEYFTDHRTADRGIPSFNGRPFSTDESTFFGNADLSDTEVEVQNYSALIEHEFDSGVTIRNRTRYADYDKYYQNVFAASPVSAATGNYTVDGYRDDTQRENLFNQTDVLYNLQAGSIEHKLLGGVEVGRQDNENFRRNAVFTSPTAVAATSPTYTGGVLFPAKNRDSRTDIDILGVYLQDQIVFNPNFEAIVGARYDKFDIEHRDLTGAGTRVTADDDFVSPRAGLIYKPVETVSLYTSYSQAYVPRSGEQLNSLTVTSATFDPEKFKNTEIGAKWDISDELAFTAAIFKLERTNVAVNTGAATSALVDGQDTKGLELGISGQVTHAWSIIGGYTYQKAELVDTTSVGADGAIAPNTPRQSFALWNRYDFNDTWGAALGVISRSDMYAAFDNAVKLPGYTRLDAAVYAQLDKNLSLQLNVENLLDKEYYLYAHNNNNISPGSPTAAYATLIYDF